MKASEARAIAQKNLDKKLKEIDIAEYLSEIESAIAKQAESGNDSLDLELLNIEKSPNIDELIKLYQTLIADEYKITFRETDRKANLDEIYRSAIVSW